MTSLVLVAFLSVGSSLPLTAQLQGTQTQLTLPGYKDPDARISGFADGPNFYIAYSHRAEIEYDSTFTPAVFYGTSSLSGANLTFQNANRIDIPNVPNAGTQTAWMMAAGVAGNAPYIFQFNCARHSQETLGVYRQLLGITYEKLIPPVIPGNAPTFSKVESAPQTLVNTLEGVTDVATASMNSSLYLFVLTGPSLVAATQAVEVLKYDGSGTGGIKVVGVIPLLYYPNRGQPFRSIDASSVTLASGEQAIVLAMAAGNTDQFEANPSVTVGLVTSSFKGLQALTQPIMLSQVLHQEIQNPSVRLGYGPGLGTATTNSCTLFFGGNQSYNGTPEVEATQINLPPSLESGSLSQTGGWEELGSEWTNAGNVDSLQTEFPNRWAVFDVPVQNTTTQPVNGYSSVSDYLTLVEFGDNNVGGAQDSFVSSLALQLIPNAATAGQEWASSDLATYTGANAMAAVQGWSLLGIITGIPPLPQGSPVNYRNPVLTITYDNSQTTGSAQTSNNTVATSAQFGGPKASFNASAGYSNATIQGSQSSYSISLSLNQAFRSDSKGTYDKYTDTGYMIVSQPNYYTAHYETYAYNGTTDLGVATVTILGGGTNIQAIPFYLDQPNKPYPGYPAFIYQSFPADSFGNPLVAWPQTDDIAGWLVSPQHNILPTLTNVTNLFKTSPQYIYGSDFQSYTLGLTSTQLNAYTRGTTNKVSLGAGINFLGIKVGESGSVTLSSTQSTSFTSTQEGQVDYPQLQDAFGYSAIQIQTIFDSVGSDPDSAANWIPTIFNGSQPWILTWQVVSATPTSSKSAVAQTITFKAIGNQTKGSTITLNATASSGLPVTYTREGPVKIVGSTATFTGTGPVAIAAHQAGDTIYLPAKEVRQEFTVSP